MTPKIPEWVLKVLVASAVVVFWQCCLVVGVGIGFILKLILEGLR